MTTIPYWETTNSIRRYRKNFSHHGNMAPGICMHLHYRVRQSPVLSYVNSDCHIIFMSVRNRVNIVRPCASQDRYVRIFHSHHRQNTVLSTDAHVKWNAAVSHTHLGILSSLFPPGFPSEILYEVLSSAVHATCLAELTLFQGDHLTIL
jgi:hypothetical protein